MKLAVKFAPRIGSVDTSNDVEGQQGHFATANLLLRKEKPALHLMSSQTRSAGNAVVRHVQIVRVGFNWTPRFYLPLASTSRTLPFSSGQKIGAIPSVSCSIISTARLCARNLQSTSFVMATSVLLRTLSPNFRFTALNTLSTFERR